jgi:hypothetical protein
MRPTTAEVSKAELFDGVALNLDHANLQRHLVGPGDGHHVQHLLGRGDEGASDLDDAVGLAGAGHHAGQDDAVVDALRRGPGSPGMTRLMRVLQRIDARVDADAQRQDGAAGAVEEDGIGLARGQADDRDSGAASAVMASATMPGWSTMASRRPWAGRWPSTSRAAG